MACTTNKSLRDWELPDQGCGISGVWSGITFWLVKSCVPAVDSHSGKDE